jgi:hypothetical protein
MRARVYAVFLVALFIVSASAISRAIPVPLPFLSALAACVAFDPTARTICYEDRIPALYPQYPIHDIFRFVRTLQAYDPALLDCHFLAHRLGGTAVAHDPGAWFSLFSDQDPDSMCADGFIHGVAETALSGEQLTESDVNRLGAVCSGAGAPKHFDAARSCFHGVGHLLYYASGEDIRQAMVWCDLAAPESMLTMRRLCYTGAAMPAFEVPRGSFGEPSSVTRIEAVKICEQLDSREYRAACTRTTWGYYWDEIRMRDGVDDLCGREEGALRNHCYGVVFRGVALTLGADYATYHAICSRVAPDQQAHCYDIPARIMMTNAGGDPEGVRAALTLCRASVDEEACVRVLADRAYRYSAVGSMERHAFCSIFPEIHRPACEGSETPPLEDA